MAAFGLTSMAIAEGPAWTYVDLGYVIGDSDDNSQLGEGDYSGYSARASLEFLDNFHTRLEYVDADWSDDAGQDGYTIALGAHTAITESTDLVTEFIYTDQNIDNGFIEYSYDGYDGYGLNVGLRTLITDKLELSGGVSIRALEVNDCSQNCDQTQVTIYFGGQYFVNDDMSVGIDYSEFDVQTTDDFGSMGIVNIYARWSFDDLL